MKYFFLRIIKTLILSCQLHGKRRVVFQLICYPLTAPVRALHKWRGGLDRLLIACSERGLIAGPLDRVLPRPRTVRRRIRHGLSPGRFFAELQRLGADYIVLRQYHPIDDWPIDEDIDILIADQDADRVSHLFGWGRSANRIDLYTVSHRLAWRGIPYYPPYIARQVLQRKHASPEGVSIPDDRDEYYLLLFHILYHKGFADWQSLDHQEHAYGLELSRLSRHAGVAAACSAEEGIRQLVGYGWAPPPDLLSKLQQPITPAKTTEERGQFGCLVFRRKLCESFKANELIDIIRKIAPGLEIVETCELTEQTAIAAQERLRGGNWSSGPFPVSGGPPWLLIFFLDYHPGVGWGGWCHYDSGITTPTKLKALLRRALLAGVPLSQRFNPVHTTDNESEGLYYLYSIADAAMTERVESWLSQERDRYYSPLFRRPLGGNGIRARVGLIKMPNTTDREAVVQKIFRSSARNYFERELHVYTHWAKRYPFILEPLAVEDLSIILPYVGEKSKNRQTRGNAARLRSVADQIADALCTVFLEGYALIDFHPDNVLIYRGRAIIIDYEFLYRYRRDERPGGILESYDIAGVPSDFQGDVPEGGQPEFWRLWKPVLTPRLLEERFAKMKSKIGDEESHA